MSRIRFVLIFLAIVAVSGGIFSGYREDHNTPEVPDNIDISPNHTAINTPADTNASGNSAPTSNNIHPDVISYPADVLNLSGWKITLPIDDNNDGTADEIKMPNLKTFSSSFFRLNEAKDGVVFRANAGGARTANTSYPRSELREMTDEGSRASWSSFRGTHTMTLKVAISHLPEVKQELVMAQIHDAEDDVIMIRLEKNHLFVESDGKNIGELDANYKLNTRFSITIQAEAGRIKVLYNGVEKMNIVKKGSGYYFKAGCYTQTNTDKGDQAMAYGEVIIYSLKVTHLE